MITLAVHVITWTFHVHEVRVGTLNETLLLVPPLFLLGSWVQQVFCELGNKSNTNLTEKYKQSLKVHFSRRYPVMTWMLYRKGCNL